MCSGNLQHTCGFNHAINNVHHGRLRTHLGRIAQSNLTFNEMGINGFNLTKDASVVSTIIFLTHGNGGIFKVHGTTFPHLQVAETVGSTADGETAITRA